MVLVRCSAFVLGIGVRKIEHSKNYGINYSRKLSTPLNNP